MGYSYDDQNIFAKILRGEIPVTPVLETEHSLAFADIAPKAPVHLLVIPRGPYVNHDHFVSAAPDAEILDFQRAVVALCRQYGLSPEAGGQGYRLLYNSGPHSHQEVPHMHVHILAGRPLGPILA